MGKRWVEKIDQLGPGWRALGVAQLAAAIANVEHDVQAWSPSIVDGWGLHETPCLLAVTAEGFLIVAPDARVRLAEWPLVERVLCQLDPPALIVSGTGFKVVLRRGPEHLMVDVAQAARERMARVATPL